MGRFEEKSHRLTFVWLLLQFLQFTYVVSAWIANKDIHLVEDVDSDDPSEYSIPRNRVEAFTLTWLFLLAIIFSLSGVLVLRFRRTRTALGFFVGVAWTMASWTMTLAVEAGNELIQNKDTGVKFNKKYMEIRSLSAVLLCLVYCIFGVLLMSWQEDLVVLTPAEQRVREQDEDEICTKNIEPVQTSCSSTGESVIQA